MEQIMAKNAVFNPNSAGLLNEAWVSLSERGGGFLPQIDSLKRSIFFITYLRKILAYRSFDQLEKESYARVLFFYLIFGENVILNSETIKKFASKYDDEQVLDSTGRAVTIIERIEAYVFPLLNKNIM